MATKILFCQKPQNQRAFAHWVVILRPDRNGGSWSSASDGGVLLTEQQHDPLTPGSNAACTECWVSAKLSPNLCRF